MKKRMYTAIFVTQSSSDDETDVESFSQSSSATQIHAQVRKRSKLNKLVQVLKVLL